MFLITFKAHISSVFSKSFCLKKCYFHYPREKMIDWGTRSSFFPENLFPGIMRISPNKILTNLIGMNIFFVKAYLILNTGKMYCTLFSTMNNKLINSVLLFSWFHDWWQQTFDGNNKISYPKNYYWMYCE